MKYRQRRIPCQHPVKISTPGGRTSQAIIRNVHPEGAKLEGLENVEVGDTCTLTIDAIPVPAVVRWTGDGAAGVQFQRKLMPRQFELVSHIVKSSPGAARRQRRQDWGYAQLR